MNMDSEPRHPIGVAVERTGLSADVIRVWERRYGVVVPARSDGGQRLYSDADVERLRLLRRATEGGRSIGQVAELEGEALAALVREDEAARRAAPGRPGPGADAVDARAEAAVDALVGLTMRLDGDALEVALRRHLAEWGFSAFAERVAAPLLRRLGDGWHAGRVTASQEHLASAALRRVLESARGPGRPGGANGAGGPAAVVTTLAGERHEAGALMAAVAADLAGWRVVYLGADLPPEEVAAAALVAEARAVCASVVYAPSPEEVVERFRVLRLSLPDDVVLYAGGGGAARLAEPLEKLGVRCPPSVEALRSELTAHVTSPG